MKKYIIEKKIENDITKKFVEINKRLYEYEDWMEELELEDINRILKWRYLVAYFRWFPDLFFDLIKPAKGGIHLNMYQRVLIRALARFQHVYVTLPRGAAKTYGNVLNDVHECIFYPRIRVSITAETREQSAKIAKDKLTSEIFQHFPCLKEELYGRPQFGHDYAEIEWKNHSILDTLANSHSTKGLRRHRLRIEESARLNSSIYEDALEPVVNSPRRTSGAKAIEDLRELNASIHFFTTSAFKGSEEFNRTRRMIHGMANCDGSFVFGADYRLPVHFGMQKMSVIEKSYKNNGLINFQMNYGSVWVGAVDNALVNMQHLMDAQKINCISPIRNGRMVVDTTEEITKKEAIKKKNEGNKYKLVKKVIGEREYIIAVDVAKSDDSKNNKTVFAVIGFTRHSDNTVDQIYIERLVVPPNGETYESQALPLKRLERIYKPNQVIIDAHSYGQGLIEALTKDYTDPLTGRPTEKWSTTNVEDGSYCEDKIPNSRPLIYAIKSSSSIETTIITNFQSCFSEGKVKLPCVEANIEFDASIDPHSTEALNIRETHINATKFIEEVSNLKAVLTNSNSGNLRIQKVTTKLDKDRYSAVTYGLYYIKIFEDVREEDEFEGDINDYNMWD